MKEPSAPAAARVVSRAKDDPDVLAVLLFGSRARGEAGPGSDFDVCLVLATKPPGDVVMAQKRLEYAAESEADIAIFQELPLHVRSRVLKEGEILFARDEDALYALAIRTARTYDDFKHIQREYLEQVARG